MLSVEAVEKENEKSWIKGWDKTINFKQKPIFTSDTAQI